jgi:hypothetical protein
MVFFALHLSLKSQALKNNGLDFDKPSPLLKNAHDRFQLIDAT